jgi:hypothetical protein
MPRKKSIATGKEAPPSLLNATIMPTIIDPGSSLKPGRRKLTAKQYRQN